MECFKYAFNILTVFDGMCTINLGGLQADLQGGSGGAGYHQILGWGGYHQISDTNPFEYGHIDTARRLAVACTPALCASED